MNPQLLLLVLFLVVGMLLAALSVPLMQGKVPPNAWYGFRVRRTLEDPQVWYPGNRYAASWMCASGLVLMGVAVGAYAMLPARELTTYAFSCLAALLASLAVGLIQSLRYLRKLPPAPAREGSTL